MQIIEKYFPHLTAKQKEQFQIMETLYPEWNSKINVISRKDIDNLEINHLLHSLAIAKFITFSSGTRILDLGTGGGLPGLPLAVLFPSCSFLLVDRTGKKLKVAQDIAKQAHLENVTVQQADAQELKSKFDFIVSRAVMDLRDMVPLAKNLISHTPSNNPLPNGLLCLKGGDIAKEIMRYGNNVLVENISNYFNEPYFETKKIIYLPL